LLRTETHIEFLDEYGNFDGLLEEYSGCTAVIKINFRIKFTKRTETILWEKKDIYAYQIKEIDNITPEDGEEEKLNEELNILENSEKLLELTSSVYELIYDSEILLTINWGKFRMK